MSKKQMIINYVPGEECRVAIVEDGRLEEFHSERMDGPSNHVGNIYVGKVQNIDFGLEANGFLHTSDVHPQYFPGEENDKTERVGRKTPRRERPPIQDCFRRGDEVAVQVLKEGVGTKGPTVTSYLSIPGRFLVMMPQMDKVGVSRKVEDEDTRRKMREILDQLDLPEGFGFILRTAGMERSKAELKRDLAYLMRLWKDMERRWKTGNKPRLLYSESDLLVRALRDLLTTDIDEVVVDNEAALQRAARFLKIVAPRTSTRVVHYTGKAPIFHVMGIEPQIQMIHGREVPLPSGGRLVIDETEALVAIDVNSGRSREARDSETNAYETNLEAVDEICRQLRLRDLGGVVVSDLIDMRSAKHRRDIETRFQANLKKDRARWTTAPISEFGILEMTRQRMRASHESQHFADCPTCRGRGLVQKPDSVAADALRDLAALLDNDGVRRVELVVNPRLAGELLSTRRRALSRIERGSGNPPKHVDVRVSEAIPVDRVTFYAYDERGADLDLAKLGHRAAKPEELLTYEIASDAAEEEPTWAVEPEVAAPEPELYPEEQVEDAEAHPIELEPLSLAEINAQDRPQASRAPRGAHAPQQQQQQGGAPLPPGEEFQGEGGRRRRRRRRRGGRGRDGQFAPQQGQPYPQQFDESGAPMAPLDDGGQPVDGSFEGEPYGDQQPAHSINVEDQETIIADPTHAVGEGTHHHDQFNLPGMNPGQNLGDMSGEGGRRRRRRRGRRGRGNRGPDMAGAPGAPMEPGQYPQDQFNQPQDGNFQQPYDGPGGEQQDNFEQGNEPFAPQGAAGEYAEAPEGAYGPQGDDDSFGNAPPAQGAPPFAGEQGEQGEQGPGGPRRRRRRRGRGGQGGPGQGGPGQGGPGQAGLGQGAPVPQGGRGNANFQPGKPAPSGRPAKGEPAPTSLADMFRSTPEGGGGEQEPQDFGPAESGAPEAGFHDDGPGGPPDQPTDDGAPRPRRRRGGRGRNRDSNRDGARPDQTNQPQGDRPPAREPAPRPSAPPPKPAAPAPQPAGGQPKIRTLYGSRKRLAPGVTKTIKRDE
jgi:ribonuclease E